MGRRRIVAIVFGAASLLGIGLYARRGRAHDRIDLYFGDGSVISLDGASAEAARLVPLVHDALRTARS